MLVLVSMVAFTSCDNDDDGDPDTPDTSNVITDDGSGTGTTTWTADKEWILDGFVFVNSGQTLTIEAGTVIKGKPGQGADASALIVARGGKLIANGTAANPIIFTAEEDDVNEPNDIPANTTGLWGGLIVLGNAPLNSDPGSTQIEGIPETETRGLYGGNAANDNSGVFKYISIRYGGTNIGAGNEINGFTLGGVGSGTEIDYVEVIFNADDGIEFFGGNPNAKHLAVAFVGDDSFDYDEGYDGKGQFWFTVQNSTVAGGSDRCGEHDGGTSPETGEPFATPEIYNATYIGRGAGEGKRTITFRDNAGGTYANSIFVEQDRGIDVEILGNGDNSYTQWQNDRLMLMNNTFWNVAGNTEADIFRLTPAKYGTVNDDGTPNQTAIDDSTMQVNDAIADFAPYFADANNQVFNPGINVGYTPGSNLNPVPANTVAAGAAVPSDGFFENVNYSGAFGNTNWLKGWSLLDQMGYLAD
ncbi:MAG: hypothetical protein AAGI38_18945 [Bacteroidota bacterium]